MPAAVVVAVAVAVPIGPPSMPPALDDLDAVDDLVTTLRRLLSTPVVVGKPFHALFDDPRLQALQAKLREALLLIERFNSQVERSRTQQGNALAHDGCARPTSFNGSGSEAKLTTGERVHFQGGDAEQVEDGKRLVTRGNDDGAAAGARRPRSRDGRRDTRARPPCGSRTGETAGPSAPRGTAR